MNSRSIVVAVIAFILGLAIGWGVSNLSGANAPQSTSSTAPAVASVDEKATEQEQGSSAVEAASAGEASQDGNAASADDAAQTDNAGSTASVDEEATSVAPDTSADQEREEETYEEDVRTEAAPAASSITVTEDGTYTSKDEVAAYIHLFGHLPSNYISKSKARSAGWVSSKGNLDDVLPGMSIGGSEFYNNEELLPDAPGRRWTECDINYEGGFRGAERIVFSNDGLIFYTADHYNSFEQLY